MTDTNDTYIDLFSGLLLAEIERKRDKIWSFWIAPIPGDQSAMSAMVRAAETEFRKYEPLYTVLQKFVSSRSMK